MTYSALKWINDVYFDKHDKSGIQDKRKDFNYLDFISNYSSTM